MVNKIIYFGNVTSKFFYLILNTLSSVVFAIIDSFLSKFEQELIDKKQQTYGSHAFIHYFRMFSAEATTLVLYVLQKKSYGRQSVTINDDKKEEKIKHNKSTIGLIILVALLDLSNCIEEWSIESPSNLISDIFNV